MFTYAPHSEALTPEHLMELMAIAGIAISLVLLAFIVVSSWVDRVERLEEIVDAEIVEPSTTIDTYL